MRHALAILALLAVAASPRGGCGKPHYDPCAGKSCGDGCTACAPLDPRCAETAVVKACDPDGACVPAGIFTCPAPRDPCAGKVCGEECSLCGETPCLSPVATACDRSGACVPASSWTCYDPCASRACHAPCDPCPPGATDCLAVLCITWCDGAGECVCAGGGAACR